MPTTKYSEEELNYFRICHVATNILPENLREIFKREWDSRYQNTLGEWEDTPNSGLDFLNGESPSNRKKNARLLATMQQGNRAEWDCTMLFYAILYSSSIHGLNPAVYKTVNELREFRNQIFAHKPDGRLKDTEFQNAVRKVLAAFQALGLATDDISTISKQSSFPTNELHVLEKQLEKEAGPFSVLPLRPSHHVTARPILLDEIVGCLQKLRSSEQTGLTGLYISGSPGSGKSQLARQVGEQIIHEQHLTSPQPTFVMNVEADNTNTILQSYVKFARNLKCPEYALSNIIGSKTLDAEARIGHLRSLIATKLPLYSNWLVIIDNANTLASASALWPQPGSDEWRDGQVLITTQDSISMTTRNNNVCVANVSISKGMRAQEAVQLLNSLSGLSEDPNTLKVAKALDFQPLALASAAEYVNHANNAILSSTISWEQYLHKLEEGKRKQTEKVLSQVNSSYPQSMTTAIEMAVKRAAETEEEIRHAFDFLSMFAPEPVPLNVVVQYVLNINSTLDRDIIKIKIAKCSLVLLENQPNGPVLIRVHQVVRASLDSLKTKAGKADSSSTSSITAAVVAFAVFLDTNVHYREGLKDIKYFTLCKSLAPHLFVLFDNHVDTIAQNLSLLSQEGRKMASIDLRIAFSHFGRVTSEFSYYLAANSFYNLALKLIRDSRQVSKVLEIPLLLNLGEISGCLKDFTKSKEYLSQALKCSEQCHGRESVNVAACLQNLGNIALKLSQVDDARNSYLRALTINLKHFDEDDVRVASSLQNVGSVHFVLGDFHASKDCYEKAVKIYEKKCPDGNPALATVLKNLANAKHHLGELDEAKRLQLRALNMTESFYGPKHLDVATSLDCLGNICRSLGELKEATSFHTRSLRIKKDLLGIDHLSVAMSYVSLGDDANALDQLDTSEECYRCALALMTTLLGCDHFDVGRCLHKLAKLHERRQELDIAVERVKLALEVYRNCQVDCQKYITGAKEVLERVSKKMANLDKRTTILHR